MEKTYSVSVSNSSRAIRYINTTRSLEKRKQASSKQQHPCYYAIIVMSLCPMECRGRKNQEIKGTSPDTLPPSGSRKGGGAGYARLERRLDCNVVGLRCRYITDLLAVDQWCQVEATSESQQDCNCRMCASTVNRRAREGQPRSSPPSTVLEFYSTRLRIRLSRSLWLSFQSLPVGKEGYEVRKGSRNSHQ